MEMLSNGILDIEDTEGEEISLTAEGPQFTEDIFRTISREELIQEQRKDRLLSKVIYFKICSFILRRNIPH